MPLVSAVLVVRPNRVSEVCAELSQDTRVTVGDPTRNRIPVVLESETRRDDRNFWNAMDANPMVEHHHIIFADLSDLTNPLQTEVSQ